MLLLVQVLREKESKIREMKKSGDKEIEDASKQNEESKGRAVFMVVLNSTVNFAHSSSSINCTQCEKTLKEPVMLPCGHTICKSQVVKTKEESNKSIKCVKCHEDHEIPEKGGFPVNKLAQEFLDRKFDLLDQGNEYRKAVDSLRNLKGEFDGYTRMNASPHLELHDVISSLKNDIDLRREKVKTWADEQAIDLTKQLDEFERARSQELAVRKDSSRPNDEIESLIESTRKDLEKWENEIEKFEINEIISSQIRREADLRFNELKKKERSNERNRIHKRILEDTSETKRVLL